MKHSKSSLFLMELIIALLFFALSSTVCIRLFVYAHSLSQQTVDTNYALNYAQNMAEAFTGCDGDLQAMETVLASSCLSGDGSSLFLEQNGYCTTLTSSGSAEPGGTISADIRVCKTSEPELALYTLHVDLYTPHVK